MINWWIFFLGQWFWLCETAHYGWNLTARSDGEMACDGIVFLITAISLIRVGPTADGVTK